MKIEKLFDIEGAKKATGIVVIIDIYRAASLAAYLLGKKAKYVIPVTTKEEAFFLKSQNKNYILAGEEQGIKIDGFDFGNSPSEVSEIDLEDKIIVHRSTQGTRGIINAINADEIIFGSFPVTSAVVNYIFSKNPEIVSVVAMDGEDTEDDIFANFLIDKLKGNNPDFEKVKEKLIKHRRSARFFDETQIHSPREDIDLCLQLDIFNFVPIVDVINKKPILKKIVVKQ